MTRAQSIMALLANIENQGGHVAITQDDRGMWLVGSSFGKEAEDSPMAGGATFGVDEDLDTALAQAASLVEKVDLDTTENLHVLLTRGPGPDSDFVETEDDDGRGVGVGEWHRHGDLWCLKIPIPSIDLRRSP